MQTKTKYITRDGNAYDSAERAENHCLEKATLRLRDLLARTSSYVPNIYGVAVGVVNHPETYKELTEIVEWLKDSKLNEPTTNN